MAECKDCVHNEVCPVPHLKDAYVCKQFKDRTKYAEVVRCVDCRRCIMLSNSFNNEVVCGKRILTFFKPDDFCSCGERREGE